MVDINVFSEKYLTLDMDGHDFDIYLISDMLGENHGTTNFNENKLIHIINKLDDMNTELQELKEKKYTYFDIEYTITKNNRDNNVINNIIQKEYVLQDIYQSKLLINIYKKSVVDRNSFPNIDTYHDESSSKIKKYRLGDISIFFNYVSNICDVHIVFSYKKSNTQKIKKDLTTVFTCFSDILN